MQFEFDDSKSQLNKQKHGLDFIEAQQLWADLNRVEIQARAADELRFIVIGSIGPKVWSAVITYRGDNIRIISVRRSRPKERKLYEG